MSQGVVPTVGRGAASPAFRGAEDILAAIPGVGHVIRRGQQRAIGELKRRIVNRADPTDLLAANAPEVPIGTPREIISDLAERVSKEWDAALSQVKPIPKSAELDNYFLRWPTSSLKILARHI